MSSRRIRLASCLAAVVALPTLAASPPQYFVVCASAFNLPTVYVSGIVEAQPAAFEQVRTGFAGYLAQHFSYKGTVACMPTNSQAAAQKAVESRSTALRNMKKSVVETGWTEGSGSIVARIGAALAPTPASSAMPQASAKSAQPSVPVGTAAAGGGRTAAGSAPSAPAGSGAGSSAAGAGTSSLASALGSIFGTSATCSGGGNGTSAGGSGKGDKASGAPSGSDTGCQSPYAQVSSTLTSLFGSSGSSGSSGTGSGGAQSAAAGDPGRTAAAPQQEGLGSAEAQSTKLVVYGCGRHDMQIACVTDLTNENQQDTLVLSDVWKDAFIVDDRGDRHPRSKGFFLNVDGDQRSQLDIGYGKTARFVLLFDDVQSKVQKVALRCASAGLDVEDISLMVSTAGASPAQAR